MSLRLRPFQVPTITRPLVAPRSTAAQWIVFDEAMLVAFCLAGLERGFSALVQAANRCVGPSDSKDPPAVVLVRAAGNAEDLGARQEMRPPPDP